MAGLKCLAGWLPVILTRRALAARLDQAETAGTLAAFRYAQACKDDLVRRIDAGPPRRAAAHLRLVRDDAA